jgi:hypothetical protein
VREEELPMAHTLAWAHIHHTLTHTHISEKCWVCNCRTVSPSWQPRKMSRKKSQEQRTHVCIVVVGVVTWGRNNPIWPWLSRSEGYRNTDQRYVGRRPGQAHQFGHVQGQMLSGSGIGGQGKKH